MPDREYFNIRRKNRRQRFIDLLGGKCERCSSTKNLQFDHRQPNKKEFRISDRIDAPEDILLKEVMKCRLLCAKCHRDKTHEMEEHGQNHSEHGTIWHYKHYGCRCDKCRQAMSEYNKKHRQLNMVENRMKLNNLADRFRKNADYRELQDPTPVHTEKVLLSPEGEITTEHEYLPNISEEEGVEMGVLKPSEENKPPVDKTIDLMKLIIENSAGDPAVVETTMKLSKTIDQENFPVAFDLLKILAKNTDKKETHKFIIELAHVIADIRNDLRLIKFEDED